MASRMLRNHDETTHGWEKNLIAFIDRRYEEVHGAYMRVLRGSQRSHAVTLVFAGLVLSSIYFLYGFSQRELAPTEDEGFAVVFSTPASNATQEQRELWGREVYDIASKYEEMATMFQILSPGMTMSGIVLKPWDERNISAMEVQTKAQADMNTIAGTQNVVFQPPTLPGSFGLPIQVSIGTTQPFSRLDEVARQFHEEALKSGRFIFLNTDLKFTRPQSHIDIDRDKVAQLGLTMSDIGNAMSTMLGGGYVNYFSIEGRSYRVIPQVQQSSRLNAEQLLDYHIRTADGSTVPLSTVATISTKTVPESLNHFQQLNSATIQGVQMPGQSLGASIEYLQELAERVLPAGYFLDYGGSTRQFVQESAGFLVTFGFALIIIYLALAAQFESFRDPIIILVSVPMSIAGALVFISLGVGGATLNIYTQVGLVTLMGLISKHGILLVEFANELQKSGKSKAEAIEAAASIRLRPILMTTAAMVFGVLPLIFASGAGVEASVRARCSKRRNDTALNGMEMRYTMPTRLSVAHGSVTRKAASAPMKIISGTTHCGFKRICLPEYTGTRLTISTDDTRSAPPATSGDAKKALPE
jgi:multidrug efflux pump